MQEEHEEYVRTKVMENAVYNGLGMMDLEDEDEEEDESIRAFDPLGKFRRSK